MILKLYRIGDRMCWSGYMLKDSSTLDDDSRSCVRHITRIHVFIKTMIVSTRRSNLNDHIFQF
jgi:hypothetical protein